MNWRRLSKTLTYRVLGFFGGYYVGSLFGFSQSANFWYNITGTIVMTIGYWCHEKLYDRFWKKKK